MGDISLFPIKYMPNTGKHRYLVEKKTFNLLKQYQELLANIITRTQELTYEHQSIIS
jgi:hypothetical protein